MDDKSFHVRVPKRWARVAMIVTVTAMIVAPLTALASHTFTDVSNSNTFHADIDWLASAGVTKGCNPPINDEYCPNDFVTRGQMSAFMRRFAQYIGAEDGTPAEADHAASADNANTANNADKVDGYHADELSRVAMGTGGSMTLDSADGTVVLADVAIEVPASSQFVEVSGQFNAWDFSNGECPCEVDYWIREKGVGTLSTVAFGIVQGDSLDGDAFPIEWVFEADPGTHTYELIARVFFAPSNPLSFNYSRIVAKTVPFGSTGGSTLGTVQPETDLPAGPASELP